MSFASFARLIVSATLVSVPIAKLLGAKIAVPSFSTLSRSGNSLTLRVQPLANGYAGIKLVEYRTDLKIHGAGVWLEEKHKTKRKPRSWRKLHLGLGLVSGEIVCSDLTNDGGGDSTASGRHQNGCEYRVPWTGDRPGKMGVSSCMACWKLCWVDCVLAW